MHTSMQIAAHGPGSTSEMFKIKMIKMSDEKGRMKLVWRPSGGVAYAWFGA